MQNVRMADSYRRLVATWSSGPSSQRQAYMFDASRQVAAYSALYMIFNDVDMVAIYPDIGLNANVGEKADVYDSVSTIQYSTSVDSGYNEMLALVRAGTYFLFTYRLAEQLNTHIVGNVDITPGSTLTVQPADGSIWTMQPTAASEFRVVNVPNTSLLVGPSTSAIFPVVNAPGSALLVGPGTNAIFPVANAPGSALLVGPDTGATWQVVNPSGSALLVGPGIGAVFNTSIVGPNPLPISGQVFITNSEVSTAIAVKLTSPNPMPVDLVSSSAIVNTAVVVFPNNIRVIPGNLNLPDAINWPTKLNDTFVATNPQQAVPVCIVDHHGEVFDAQSGSELAARYYTAPGALQSVSNAAHTVSTFVVPGTGNYFSDVFHGNPITYVGTTHPDNIALGIKDIPPPYARVEHGRSREKSRSLSSQRSGVSFVDEENNRVVLPTETTSVSKTGDVEDATSKVSKWRIW